MFLNNFYGSLKNAMLLLIITLFAQTALAQKEVPYFGKINWIKSSTIG